MTGAEAKKLEDAARKWAAYACEYGARTVEYSFVMKREEAFLALLNAMIDEPKE